MLEPRVLDYGLLAVHLRPKTIRRLARRRRWSALELSRRERLRERWRRFADRLGHPAVVLAGSLVIGIGVLFLPLHVGFGALADDASARDFLSTLWQVEGGTIALTLTLILVAFEAIWRGRFRGSVRRFAEEVGLLYAIAAAFVSLIAIAVTLLGWGEGAPGRWAATWSVCLSGLAFGAVPIVLVRTLLLMNPATLHERRLQQIRGEVHDAVDEEAFERLAYGELKTRTEQVSALDLAPMLIWRPRGNLIAIEATAAGVVSDIKIGRLARIARKLQKDAEEAVTVAAYVGQYTPRGSVLVLAAEHASRRQRWRIRRAFAIDTRLRRSRLYDLISHLHQEALQAIREVQPSTYDDIAELWVELLLALPQAWQRYGHSFDESSAGEFGRFGLGPADATAKNLYVEAREATKAMHDLAAEAFMLPDRVATRSLDYDAPALLLRMLALYVELYPTVAELEDGRLRERLLHLVFELSPQLGRTIEHEFRRIDLPAADRDRAERNLQIVFRTVMELMKAIADQDPRDADRIAKVNSSWGDIFSGWQPEHDREQEWPGLPEEELIRHQEHNADLDVVVNSKTQLDELRDAYRFALAYWALHRLENRGDTAWADVLKIFLPWLGSVEKLARQADQVVQIDLDTHLFLQWHQTAVQMGWAAPRAFLVFVLLQHAPDQIPPEIGVPRFLRGTMSAEIEQMLDAVATNQELWQLLGSPPEDLDQRVEALRTAIRTAGQAARGELGLA
jgi:hypothetical protein